jgi:thymidine phosphorylase
MIPFLPQEFIRKKRDGFILSSEDIGQFVGGIVSGHVTEAHMAAFAMAVFFSGMTVEERAALTRAMAHSGQVFSWNLNGPVVDKHSTGGVGDTTSLVLAPILAACGAYVPMISGRGLGHTGGTTDKMESISGYQVEPNSTLFRHVVESIGCAIIGQTPDIAPADRKLYGVRDVTATVESISLITASILSKKMAEGLDALVMDVKYGNGAFMAQHAQAQELGESLKIVAESLSLPIDVLLTDMNQPLASSAGNAVEVAYALEFLTGDRREAEFYKVVQDLAASALLLGKLASDTQEAYTHIERVLDSGQALERFERMVHALGGPHSHQDYGLEKTDLCVPIYAPETGIIVNVDVREIGCAVIALGGGRTVPYAPIDHAVGFTQLARLGAPTCAGETVLGYVHARTCNHIDLAKKALIKAYKITNKIPE